MSKIGGIDVDWKPNMTQLSVTIALVLGATTVCLPVTLAAIAAKNPFQKNAKSIEHTEVYYWNLLKPSKIQDRNFSFPHLPHVHNHFRRCPWTMPRILDIFWNSPRTPQVRGILLIFIFSSFRFLQRTEMKIKSFKNPWPSEFIHTGHRGVIGPKRVERDLKSWQTVFQKCLPIGWFSSKTAASRSRNSFAVEALSAPGIVGIESMSTAMTSKSQRSSERFERFKDL